MVKAFPRPWVVAENPAADDLASNGLVIRPDGQFPHGLWIADVGRKGDPQAIVNANFIISAVNGVKHTTVVELIGAAESRGDHAAAKYLTHLLSDYLRIS